jgi:pyrimidine-nucleoside phosphorylase
MNAELIGTAAIHIGAGRFKKDDVIDPSTGITVHKKIGDIVEKGETIATLHYNCRSGIEKASELVKTAYSIGSDRPPRFQLVYEVIG